jgi:hypothetical protein
MTTGRKGPVDSTSDSDGTEDPEDEASRESFPASDPPSSWAGEEWEAVSETDPPPAL